MSMGKYVGIAWLLLGLHLSRLRFFYGAFLAFLLIGCVGYWMLFLSAPSSFPTGSYISIEPGQSVSSTARELEEANVIHSATLFKIVYRLTPGLSGVQSGTYVFEKPVGILAVARNLAQGVSGIPRIKVTFPEGTTALQMSEVLAEAVPDFDAERFLLAAEPAEGYLFPDTYFLLPNTTEAEIVELMRANYVEHTKDLTDELEKSGATEEEIIIMASLLEGEGKTLEDRRMIAGILWKRLNIGMALQVDAPFGYIHGKTGYAPTSADLKSDNAYNTYLYKGLPPTPINNPGDVSILAALTPTKSEYLYYITGTEGGMHYARTFAEHIENQKKYFK